MKDYTVLIKTNEFEAEVSDVNGHPYQDFIGDDESIVDWDKMHEALEKLKEAYKDENS